MSVSARWSQLCGRFGLEEGSVLPLVAVMIVVLVGFVALAVDWGRLHEERRALQNTVDAAALAGARELPAAPGSAQEALAIQLARSYVTMNGAGETPTISVTCRFSCSYGLNDQIVVGIERTVNNFVAGVIGIPQSMVNANAVGIAGSAGGSSDCILPLAALLNDPSDPPGGNPFFFAPYEYTMKQDALGGWSGNRQGMDLYGSRQAFYDALRGTCPSNSEQLVTVGDNYSTETGNWGNQFLNDIQTLTASEPTPWAPLTDYAYWDAGKGLWVITKSSPRFVLVPLVDYYDLTACSGSSCYIPLKGLAMFFLTFLGCQTDTGDVAIWDAGGSCPPGKGVLRGEYIQTVVRGKFTPYDPFGTQVQRLWQ